MQDLHVILKSRFGFDEFRNGQKEAIEGLFESQRILCIQPTGHGKSLLYQLPSLMIDGMTLVISPLLALVRDQHVQLRDRFQIAAASINSDQTLEENNEIKRGAVNGDYKILFIAPEQLDNLNTMNFLLELPINLLVVDEAHCISTWGHDFRPSYRQIVTAVRKFEAARKLMVLGLTATADHKTEEDIASQLASESGAPLKIFRHSMDRPNLCLSTIKVDNTESKLAYIEEKIKSEKGFGLLYCATREQTELVASYLKSRSLNVGCYHAGLGADEKVKLQKNMMSGDYQAIASTNALGMGIDKQDIRYVIHVDLPSSITAYYQEVGRAGRDGLNANGVLLFNEADRKVQDYFINSAQPSEKEFRAVIDAVKEDSSGNQPSITSIKVKTGLHPTKVIVIVAELIEQAIVEKRLVQRKQVYFKISDKSPVLTRFTNQHKVRIAELEKMIQYGEGSTDCLMAKLRRALGDDAAAGCGRCSLCLNEVYEFTTNQKEIAEIANWILYRDTILPAKRTHKQSAGLALFNAEAKLPEYIDFMRQRAVSSDFSDKIKELLRAKLTKLAEDRKITAIVMIPSRTWKSRVAFGKFMAELLGVELFTDYLYWQQTPDHRQGELLNQDQRKANVKGLMSAHTDISQLDEGNILLVDDYIGSGNTLSEACRVLRKNVGFKGEIVPLTVAKIRWKLGSRGMI